MTFAQVTDTTITTISGRLPNRARRIDNDNWIEAFPDASVALREACGWYEIIDVPRPADTATTTHDRTVEIVNGTPTVVWTPRPKTQSELDAETAQTNRTAIDDAITAALAELQQIVDFPAVGAVPDGTMTTAQLSNVMRAMRTAVQENRTGVQRVAATLRQTIRLVRGDFDGIN